MMVRSGDRYEHWAQRIGGLEEWEEPVGQGAG